MPATLYRVIVEDNAHTGSLEFYVSVAKTHNILKTIWNYLRRDYFQRVTLRGSFLTQHDDIQQLKIFLFQRGYEWEQLLPLTTFKEVMAFVVPMSTIYDSYVLKSIIMVDLGNADATDEEAVRDAITLEETNDTTAETTDNTVAEVTCWGCREDQPNQMAHMERGGCMYMPQYDDLL